MNSNAPLWCKYQMCEIHSLGQNGFNWDFSGKKLLTQNKPTHSFSQVLGIKSEPCLVEDLLQGWSMVQVGISTRGQQKMFWEK